MDVFDAAERYGKEGRTLVVLAGKDYGSGSSRDWAAKGPWILVSSICDRVLENGLIDSLLFTFQFYIYIYTCIILHVELFVKIL